MNLLDFANIYMYDPMKCIGGAWEQFSSGYFHASGGYYFRARELTKLGMLYTQNGSGMVKNI